MSSRILSDEVAEDFRNALTDLQLNSRYEISNLTVIAKENTEHALAISEALKDHIKATSREKKLPAFYVLDSIVKNVGTPYTLFFGRQLYSTFMAAYALVDQPVRRKMDEMLKTWKEPVPGSMDTRPVFPPEVTRPIENALIRAKTSYLQESRSQPNAYQQPSGHMSQQPFNQHYQQPAQIPQQTTNQQYQQPPQIPQQTTNQQYQQPPQISQQTTNQHYQPPAQIPQQTTNQHYQPPAHMSQQPTSQQSPENRLDPVTLNTIMATLIARGVLPAVPASVQTPLQPITSIPPGFPPPLLSTPPPIPQYLSTPPSQARTPLAEIPNDVVLKPASLKIPRPHLISALYERLGNPCSQCGRRFHADEEGKKKKTAHMDWHFRVRQRMAEAESRGQHRSWYVDELDWIRSREGDDESGAATVDSAHGSGVASAAVNDPKKQYIPVPDDPALTNSICPVCQEKFEIKWLNEAQEFVWMDARKVGNRIYHASCYAEVTKDVSSGTVLGKRRAEGQEDVPLRTKVKTENVRL